MEEDGKERKKSNKSVNKEDLFEARLRVGVAAEDTNTSSLASPTTPSVSLPPELVSKPQFVNQSPPHPLTAGPVATETERCGGPAQICPARSVPPAGHACRSPDLPGYCHKQHDLNSPHALRRTPPGGQVGSRGRVIAVLLHLTSLVSLHDLDNLQTLHITRYNNSSIQTNNYIN
ncbi:hypothetical protein E2C01_008526 [Portunus trituberculatus]|uniref:Uncharacterized protein n=1 Tax=Portunus trituberculatus TaxID=210409 RepID=A0A5B7D332_PORTR|nr:hypothetical protein [Portunus trituberculatus]